ncbi:protein DpdJ [Mycolicibacterium arenosum]|uniref:DEAD/DEAH box helicase n=1 Tax=Mycolicibacterium arenosum TaxID=2952157 RepID=A0ABT1M5G7_9MYCO|nr:protein DpdJ [Mycolicibacterium sp. CAU 1645]MCP9274057.1 DEAD/DEAH box helicase [Mycolicibacterium sp. CAU 1645]
MSDELQQALTAIELREAELLAWGAVGAEWRRDELIRLLSAHGDAEDLLREMLDLALVVQTPNGGYRSRSAETVRLLATMRQAFRNEAIGEGRRLVLDYRYLQRPRRRPCRDVSAVELELSVGGGLGQRGLGALRVLAPPMVSAFQVRATGRILAALGDKNAGGVVVTAGTGSGKTLAFYMPMLAWICDHADQGQGVRALALYPRNELLKDQLRTLVSYALRLKDSVGVVNPISLGTWFGPTPHAARWVRDEMLEAWRKVTSGFVCPFLRCPEADCDGDLIWPNQALKAGTELLRCESCGLEIPGSVLRLTRESARADPPSVMLSTTESLNRQLSSPGNLRAFGVVNPGLRAVLLDEVHIYEGTTGAQNAYLLRRLRKALGYEPLWTGLSATLTNAGEFFGRLVGLDAGCITNVEPDLTELEESGAEYLLALRHNPHGNTGTLSTTIQAAMTLSRSLDVLNGNMFDPPVDSGNVVGSRLFAFTDKLDSTNRLYWDLLDAEGWAWPGTLKRGADPLTLAHLRSRDQARLSEGKREDPPLRDADGQYWWLAEELGHEVDGDVQKRVGRTSSQDTGVSADADIIVATASLEVGFDDDRVGAVLQHKAPHDAAQFLQRKGRAGRDMRTRPWTVVILSDWGRDRDAWMAYDALFSPMVPERSLPLANLYVLRIQAVYSLLDWLSRELSYGTDSSWADASGPAERLTKDPKWVGNYRSRQSRMADLLTSLLRDGAERGSLVRHLRKSLALGDGAASDVVVNKLLWEAPRPLLGAVVPTLRRRLRDQWGGEMPAEDDSGVRTRTPLRDFVPGNLFDDLLVPDVEMRVPWTRGEVRVEHLPALRSIREFLPGNVSRHFGVMAASKRHWLAPPIQTDTDGTYLLDVADVRGVAIDDVSTSQGMVRVFSPTVVSLDSVPNEVSDASSMRADWVFSATPLGVGAPLPTQGATARFFDGLTVHLHSQGGGVRVVRYAKTAQGLLWMNGQATPKKVRFQTRDVDMIREAALGVEVHADAIQGRVTLPAFDAPPTPSERSDRLRELVLTDPGLPEAMSVFDRNSMADTVEAFAAMWDWSTEGPNDRQFADGMQSAAARLDVFDPTNPGSFSNWIGDPEVLDAVREHLAAARASERTTDWLESLRRRFTLSAAETLLAALSDVDADDLAVDLDLDQTGTFYISEQSPGGTGHIEALVMDLLEQPERLPVAIADVLVPGDLELLDVQLRSVIDSGNNLVRTAIETLVRSWPNGHQAVEDATNALDTALEAAGIALSHASRTALTTRLAGPGASETFFDEVRSWLVARDDAERSCGMNVGPRALAALLADRAEVDPFLHLDHDVTERRRSRAVSNVLWPWGTDVQSSGYFNPYVDRAGRSIEALRRHWQASTPTHNISEWSDDARREVHDNLRANGELVLRVPIASRRELRTALLDLSASPVEVGPLWCYPEVLGVHERGQCLDARVVLREVW